MKRLTKAEGQALGRVMINHFSAIEPIQLKDESYFIKQSDLDQIDKSKQTIEKVKVIQDVAKKEESVILDNEKPDTNKPK